jgi:hypothetical protein
MHSDSRLNRRELIALGCALAALWGIFFVAAERAPLSSVESRFVEYSTSGLQIVPASCVANPHHATDCSIPPVPSSGCTIVATPSSILPGQQTMITWNSASNPYGSITRTIIPTIGLVGTSGFRMVSPHQSTTYTLTMTDNETGTIVGTCAVPVDVNTDSSCPGGQILSGGTCVCPAGTQMENGTCTPIAGQCAEQFYCSGSALWRRTAQCADVEVQTCTYGCSGGGCIAPPPASGNITATPDLIQIGDTSEISWTTADVAEGSCSVQENNPDINDVWFGDNESRTSSAIEQQTMYTLACTGIDGEHFTDSVLVNIVPDWVEQ